MLFSHVETACPTVEEIGNRFRAVADFYSVFFSATRSAAAGGGLPDVLADLLQSAELAQAVPKLLPLDLLAAKHRTALNQHEFEGSLIGALVQGTCTDRVVSDEREAFEVAREIMREAVLRPNGHVQAFRMDDPRWSALTNQATLWWAYFVFESSRSAWWFVCFADPY